MPKQEEQERKLTDAVFRNEYTDLINFVSQYDAFQDLPFSQGLTFSVVDALFPNSKFVLTERDPDDWFNSLLNYHKQIFKFDNLSTIDEQSIKSLSYLEEKYIYRFFERELTQYDGARKIVRWDLLYNRDYFIRMYVERNEIVKRFFANSVNKLLVIDITREKDIAKILDFLNHSQTEIFSMPHENKTIKL